MVVPYSVVHPPSRFQTNHRAASLETLLPRDFHGLLSIMEGSRLAHSTSRPLSDNVWRSHHLWSGRGCFDVCGRKIQTVVAPSPTINTAYLKILPPKFSFRECLCWGAFRRRHSLVQNSVGSYVICKRWIGDTIVVDLPPAPPWSLGSGSKALCPPSYKMGAHLRTAGMLPHAPS